MTRRDTGLNRLHIRISKDEIAFLQDIADSQGIALADWMREAIGCKLEQDGLDGHFFLQVPLAETND